MFTNKILTFLKDKSIKTIHLVLKLITECNNWIEYSSQRLPSLSLSHQKRRLQLKIANVEAKVVLNIATEALKNVSYCKTSTMNKKSTLPWTSTRNVFTFSFSFLRKSWKCCNFSFLTIWTLKFSWFKVFRLCIYPQREKAYREAIQLACRTACKLIEIHESKCNFNALDLEPKTEGNLS